MRTLFLLGFLCCLQAFGVPSPQAQAELPDGLYAEFTTARGVFVARLFQDKAPLAVTNFVALAEGSYGRTPEGLPCYGSLSWYRVVPGFVIQGGDEMPKERFPHYPFPDECVPGLSHDKAGVLSMANGGPDTNDSVFFVTLDDTRRLDYLHTVFGYVERGREVLPLVGKDDAFSIRILRIGEAAKRFSADKASFLRLAASAAKYGGEPEPGPKAHFDDPDRLLPSEPPRAKNFNFKLANFERFAGRRVFARLFSRFTPEKPGQTPEEQVRTLASKLNLESEGLLAVYYADRREWFVAPGAQLKDAFLQGTPSVDARAKSINRQVAELARNYAAKTVASRGKDDLTDADRTKYSVDALLDTLIETLGSRH